MRPVLFVVRVRFQLNWFGVRLWMCFIWFGFFLSAHTLKLLWGRCYTALLLSNHHHHHHHLIVILHEGAQMRCACSQNRACVWWRVVKVIHIRLRHSMTVHYILCMHSICGPHTKLWCQLALTPTKHHTNWILNAYCCDMLLLLVNVCDATTRLLSHVAWTCFADAAGLRFKLFPQLSSSAELCGQLVVWLLCWRNECICTNHTPSKWKDLVVAKIWWNWLQCPCLSLSLCVEPEWEKSLSQNHLPSIHPSLNSIAFRFRIDTRGINAWTRVLVECYLSVPTYNEVICRTRSII